LSVIYTQTFTTRLFLLSVIIVFVQHTSSGQAQRGYTSGLGIKIGKFSSGASGKYFFSTSNAIALEGNLTVKKNFGTAMTTFFIERQAPIFSPWLHIPLDYIVGAGTHLAFYKSGYYKIRNGEKDAYYGNGLSAGLDLMVGIEYPIWFAPMVFSLELNPMIDIIHPGPEKVEIAASLKYVFF
jgi:hypothetical protein